MASKIYIGFIVAFILFLTYGVLNQKKDDPKAKRVACQKSVTTFEKIYKKDIQKAKELLKSSNYIINSYILMLYFEMLVYYIYITFTLIFRAMSEC